MRSGRLGVFPIRIGSLYSVAFGVALASLDRSLRRSYSLCVPLPVSLKSAREDPTGGDRLAAYRSNRNEVPPPKVPFLHQHSVANVQNLACIQTA